MDFSKGYVPGNFKYVSNQPFKRGRKVNVNIFSDGRTPVVSPVSCTMTLPMSTMGSYAHLKNQ